MFTGIIEETGTVHAVRRGTRSSQLTIRALKITEDLREGDSISTDGVCLTVTSFGKDSFTADVMPETMSRTTLGSLEPGAPVNLERALKLGGRLGGHLVSGHIDCTGRIESITKDDNAHWFRIAVGKEILKYITVKGSVSVDGISLTVAEITERGFSVSVIPHTSQKTAILLKRNGDMVNIECDMIAKYLERLINQDKGTGRISLDFLSDKGFLD
jgi:riboflavin synthase